MPNSRRPPSATTSRVASPANVSPCPEGALVIDRLCTVPPAVDRQYCPSPHRVRTTTNTNERRPRPDRVREELAGHDHRPGAGIASDRTAGMVRRRENRANYSTESGIRVSARRTNSSGVRSRAAARARRRRRAGPRRGPGGARRPRGRRSGPQRVRQRLAPLRNASAPAVDASNAPPAPAAA
jgi:hypothetical protein